MIYCINPECRHPQNPESVKFCRDCGSELILVGRYQVTKILGQGGFAKTYEVWDGTQPKVLKVLVFESPKTVELFQQEARVLSRLNHPGIPKAEPTGYFLFYPRNSRQPLHCLVMEKIQGLNLEEWMEQRALEPISEDLAIDWLKQLTLILEQVHRQQFFHRDIKPANIMLQPAGQLALIDFGSVRAMSATVLRGDVITQIVSAGYTPAEQIQGHSIPQSDFFALGRTFVYLLTGQEPHELSLNPDTGQLIWRDQAKISTILADLIDELMAFLPSGRPLNSQVILRQLKTIETKLEFAKLSHKSMSTNSLHYAGFWRRFIAYLIDTSIITLTSAIFGLVLLDITYDLVTKPQEIFIIFIGAIVLSAFGTIGSFLGLILVGFQIKLSGYQLNSIHGILLVITTLSIIIKWLYFTLMESSTYQATFGKKLLKLQVTNQQGLQISWWQANGRYWMKTLSESILMLGFVLAIIPPKKRALHDWLAGTFVLHNP